MEQPAIRNNKGMSLIEVMVALLILMIVALAVMQTALIGIRENLKNAIRDEAVDIAEQRMSELRSTFFDDPVLASGTVTESGISRGFRSATVQFTPTRTVGLISTDSKQITVSIAWTYGGTRYSHSVTSIMRKQ